MFCIYLCDERYRNNRWIIINDEAKNTSKEILFLQTTQGNIIHTDIKQHYESLIRADIKAEIEIKIKEDIIKVINDNEIEKINKLKNYQENNFNILLWNCNVTL